MCIRDSFGTELVECTEYFRDTPFRVFQAEYVGAVVMPGGASQPRKVLDGWQDWACLLYTSRCV